MPTSPRPKRLRPPPFCGHAIRWASNRRRRSQDPLEIHDRDPARHEPAEGQFGHEGGLPLVVGANAHMKRPAVVVEIEPIEFGVLNDPPGDCDRTNAGAAEIDPEPKPGTIGLALAVELAAGVLIAAACRVRARSLVDKLV